MNSAERDISENVMEILLAALAASDDLMLLLDDQDRILHASPSCERYLGLSARELCGRTMRDLDPKFPSAKVLAGEPDSAPRRISARFSTAKGQVIPVDVVVSKVQVGSRSFFSVVAREISRDVKFLGTILNSVPAKVGVIDRKMHLVKWSEHRTYEPERSVERLPTRDFTELLPERMRAQGIASIQEAFDKGSVELELASEIEPYAGAMIYLKRIMVDEEPFVAMLAMDVTERRRAEAALKESEERFRSIVQGSIDGIVLIGCDGAVAEWNPGQERITGLSRAEVLGRPSWEVRVLSTPEELRSGDLAQRYERSIRQGLETGDARWLNEMVESEIERPNGERSMVETVHFAIDLGMGRMLGSISRDITRAKDQERELRDYAAQLKALAARLADVQEAERRRLAAELHDQIGQGLTALDLTLTAASRSLTTDLKTAQGQIGRALDLTQETAVRMRDLMAQMRPIALDEYGLESALRWYAGHLSSQTEKAISVHAEDAFPRLLEPVETALFRIVQEAVTNALKHAEATDIRVILSAIPNGARVVVADDGRGFAPSEQTSTPDRGWGLIIMKERAMAVGGSLAVESGPGEGTCVRIEVPCS